MDFQQLLAAWHQTGRQLSSRRRLVAAALAGIAVVAALHVLKPAPGPTVGVWVAAHALTGGAPLLSSDLRVERLPTPDVPADALMPATSVVGKLLAAPMTRGEPMTAARLLSPSLLAAAGLRSDVAVPVRITDGPAALALVHAGDSVDIIASADSDTGLPSADRTVAHDVPVLTTPSRDDTDNSDGAEDTAGLLIVAATPSQAEALANVAGAAQLSVAVQPGP